MLKSSNGTAYELSGPADAPVMVLIHGLGLCRHLWVDYLPEFNTQYRVLNYDLFGHGDSAPIPDTASLTVYSEQLASLLDDLQIDCVVIVGFSIGGMINRRFAVDHADKVSALVILNSPHDRGAEGQRLVEERAKMVADQGALATMDSALKRWFTPEFHTSHPQTLQKVVDWRKRVDKYSYTQVTWVFAAGVTELIMDELPIKVPTLVLTCENDSGSTPAMSDSIANQIPAAQVQIIPKLQHLGLLEQPAVFISAILNFLKKAQ